MQTLLALIAVVTACVVARPPEAAPASTAAAEAQQQAQQQAQKVLPDAPNLDDYMVPQIQAAPVDDEVARGLAQLYKELSYINQFETTAEAEEYLSRRAQLRYEPYMENYYRQLVDDFQSENENNDEPIDQPNTPAKQYEIPPTERFSIPIPSDKIFAMTPLDPGYFDALEPEPATDEKTEEPKEPNALIDPRQTRQNPNLSRTKTLVASNLDKLRIGLANKEYRMPVSLLPANLNWLKIGSHDVEERSEEPGSSAGTDQPDVHIYDTEITEAHPSSLMGVALVTGISAALVLAIVGFVFGWFTLSKRAKAAADVDYPAYGVTGPTAELTGDRKLAHSAHMYHYQHQKQQILAMENNCNDTRNGSVSEPESEEENEEGDYTVYECPGFATTGDMEVKNPLFTDDHTPATPGKCEIVKPQPE